MRRISIRWRLDGPADVPLTVVAGGISAIRHVFDDPLTGVAGWWQAQSRQGLDLQDRRVLAIDWLGADGALDFAIDSADQADAITAVLDALEEPSVSEFVGASYGAMTGLQFAARHGARLGKLVAISGAHRAHPFASAWRALQRRALSLGEASGCVDEGLALARQFAMLSYRTPAEFAQRFDQAPVLAEGVARVASEGYLDHCAERFSGRMTALAYRRLSESIDLHRVDPAAIRVPATLVAVAEDQLVPLSDMLALQAGLPHSELHVLRSRFGHDAFLKETAAIRTVLRSVFAGAHA